MGVCKSKDFIKTRKKEEVKYLDREKKILLANRLIYSKNFGENKKTSQKSCESKKLVLVYEEFSSEISNSNLSLKMSKSENFEQKILLNSENYLEDLNSYDNNSNLVENIIIQNEAILFNQNVKNKQNQSSNLEFEKFNNQYPKNVENWQTWKNYQSILDSTRSKTSHNYNQIIFDEGNIKYPYAMDRIN